ncbi:DUF3306 domain-containing protein [Polaromonas eurypsychrophila]|uniref:DUF3306 domain-containing protein n=1 Tax=Polaromonas eurypsychrophila TaxID=1614635 RepID=A0A916WEU4_9BURK|nr:DUF3306 domain-containing protein [Polaromonas eurypsychrophila]GGA91211.1 hypothetical protein GCM10011496_10110 [Polaromonas eurypsychrophila]
MAEESPGFLGRWARRKTDVAQGKPLADPVPPLPTVPTPIAVPAAVLPQGAVTSARAPVTEAASGPEKILSLEDVKLLNKDSDFKPFMAGNVGPEVRNAAMKKLFADPHFNIMDGLDIYIDDYSKSDPIPESMLRQMTSSKFLKLFDAEEEDADAQKTPEAALPRENANFPADQTVAQSYESPDISPPDLLHPDHSSQLEPVPGSGASQEDHAHTDLRLQPDHAAPAPDAGRST